MGFGSANPGYVGIGTTNPLAKTHISANKSTSDLLIVQNDADATLDSSLYINKLGNVGLGTSNPLTRLYVNGQVSFPTIHKDTTDATYPLYYNPVSGKVSGMKESNHFYAYYSSTGFTRAFANSNTYYPLVVALTSPEAHGFTVDNDSAKITYTGTSGHLKIDCSVSLSGSSNDDIELQIYNVTDAAEVPTSQISTVTGNSNRANIQVIAYDINATKNDKYHIRIRNISNTNTITVYRVMTFGNIIHY
jgi:hypothetical protein